MVYLYYTYIKLCLAFFKFSKHIGTLHFCHLCSLLCLSQGLWEIEELSIKPGGVWEEDIIYIYNILNFTSTIGELGPINQSIKVSTCNMYIIHLPFGSSTLKVCMLLQNRIIRGASWFTQLAMSNVHADKFCYIHNSSVKSTFEQKSWSLMLFMLILTLSSAPCTPVSKALDPTCVQLLPWWVCNGGGAADLEIWLARDVAMFSKADKMWPA